MGFPTAAATPLQTDTAVDGAEHLLHVIKGILLRFDDAQNAALSQ